MLHACPVISILVPTRNAVARTAATCKAFLAAADATGHDVEIVVVDDESTPDAWYALQRLASDRIRVVRNPRNLGRSGTVNRAASLARGNRLLIVDCDCPPAAPDFFARHAEVLHAGADASVGRLLRRKNDFWGRYQDRAVARREAQFARGMPYAFTSQNVLIDTTWFRHIGGFDEGYAQYGFEDRDFFIRLAAAGARIAYSPEAGVIHDDEHIGLPSVARKMRDAGKFTSTYFARTHPGPYRQLGYGALDVRVRPWLWPIAKIAGPLAVWLAPAIERLLGRIPFGIARWIASATTAGSYLYGTSLAPRHYASAEATAPSPKR